MIISLITDFGLRDNFVGVMKAVILKINPRVRIVDICHEVKPQDVIGAAFLLAGSFKYFPRGTVHVAVVDPGVGTKRKKILVKTRNYFFVGPDNGVLSLAFKVEAPEQVIQISNDRYFLKPTSSTFHGRDIFAPVSAYVSRGVDILKLGQPTEHFKTLEFPPVEASGRRLIGEVIYIDRFGNLISNISKESFLSFIKNRKFKLDIKGQAVNVAPPGLKARRSLWAQSRPALPRPKRRGSILGLQAGVLRRRDKLSQSYAEARQGEPVVLIDSFNYLEIAINGGSAQEYFRAGRGEKIEVAKAI
jgi:S-adenosylmethionine hydrolase